MRPFTIDVPDDELLDLRSRLQQTRWPDSETVDDWSQGLPLRTTREMCAYWEHEYDWRQRERRLNSFAQFTTEIDGLTVHFVHVRSKNPGAVPIVLTHGWPGSFVEYLELVGPLTDPVAHGGAIEDSFDTVIPSLPGYGFSEIWEIFNTEVRDRIAVPVGASIFPRENPRASRRWASRRFTDIRQWHELGRGGHFAALEQPAVVASEIASLFRTLRGQAR